MGSRWLQAKRFKIKIYREKKRGVLKKYSSELVNIGSSVNKEGMHTLYKNKHLGVTSRDLSINMPRQAALDLSKAGRIEPLRYFRLLDDTFARARLYYSDNPGYCYIIELNRRTKVHRRSIKYLSRDIAYGRYCDDTIDWSDEFYHPLIPETHISG